MSLQELEELEVEDYVIDGLIPELAQSTRSLNFAPMPQAAGTAAVGLPGSAARSRFFSEGAASDERRSVKDSRAELLSHRRKLASVDAYGKTASRSLSVASHAELFSLKPADSDAPPATPVDDVCSLYDKMTTEFIAQLGWRSIGLHECVLGSGAEASWYLPLTPISDANAESVTSSTTLYHVLFSSGESCSILAPSLCDACASNEASSSPSPVVDAAGAEGNSPAPPARSVQGWVILKWREYGSAFGLPVTHSARDVGCGEHFLSLRAHYLSKCGPHWPWTRCWAVLYSDGLLAFSFLDSAGLDCEHAHQVRNAHGARVTDGGFWARLHLPAALQVR